MVELPKEEYQHYEKGGRMITVCTMRQKALHVIGLNQIRNKRRLYTRYGKKYYKPYRNYFDAPKGGDRDLEKLSEAGYMNRTITHEGTDRESVWYSFNRKGLDWLGEQIGVHIYDEDD